MIRSDEEDLFVRCLGSALMGDDVGVLTILTPLTGGHVCLVTK